MKVVEVEVTVQLNDEVINVSNDVYLAKYSQPTILKGMMLLQVMLALLLIRRQNQSLAVYYCYRQ